MLELISLIIIPLSNQYLIFNYIFRMEPSTHQIQPTQSPQQQQSQYEYYKKSTKIGDRFFLRFPQIMGTLVDAGLWEAFTTMVKWKLNDKGESWPKDFNKLEQQLPIEKPKFNTYENKIAYTWIGHSTAVISVGKGANIIIDPVFSKRASPYPNKIGVGPMRFRDPACQIEDLLDIDVVLVSHDHYDHLDQTALQKLYNRFPNAIFIAGLQSKSVFPNNCKFIELDWTQKKTITIERTNLNLDITFVPVCHWSRRGANDRNKRLWGGFVVETPKNRKIFYSGDTGKCGVFKEIGKEFRQFDLCILPIGAYEPRQYLKNQHVNPQEAVQIHKQLNSKQSVGVHWGTFPLGSQHYTAARTDLKKAVQKHELKKDQFITINHGGQLTVDY